MGVCLIAHNKMIDEIARRIMKTFIYKCKICKKKKEITHKDNEKPICCGKEMQKLPSGFVFNQKLT